MELAYVEFEQDPVDRNTLVFKFATMDGQGNLVDMETAASPRNNTAANAVFLISTSPMNYTPQGEGLLTRNKPIDLCDRAAGSSKTKPALLMTMREGQRTRG
jgi:hypothetical protein